MNIRRIAILFAAFVSQVNAQQEAVIPRKAWSFPAADIVDGQINYVKVLGHRRLWLLLNLTEQQRTKLNVVAQNYFETRRNTFDNYMVTVAESDLSHKDKIAAASVSEYRMSIPIDIERELTQILLPHQMEFIQTYLPLRFLLNAVKISNKDTDKKSYVKNLGVLLGVSEQDAQAIANKIRKIPEGFYDEIREILFEEIESGVKMLDSVPQRLVANRLGLEKERAELLDVTDLRSLIARRLAWRRNKSSGIAVSQRSERKFLTEFERPWLNLTDSEDTGLTKLLALSLKKKWRDSGLSGGQTNVHMTFQVRTYRNDEHRFEADRRQLTELYDSISKVLLPHQIEELHILDRWRFINVHSFTKLLSLMEISLTDRQAESISTKYSEILGQTLERLEDVQQKQHDQLVALLPQRWKRKLEKIGTDNF